jgi:aminoglycoside phosphotransferase (APT) family kinase protein
MPAPIPDKREILRIDDNLINEILEYHFKAKAKKLQKLEGGVTNHVYLAEMKDKNNYVVRVSDVPAQLNYFQKEQWASNHSLELGVPAPEILEVGNEAVPLPYMIVKKSEGIAGLEHPDKLGILRQMGKYAAKINAIETKAFGTVFDWSSNTLSKHKTWKDFLDKELEIWPRLEFFEREKLMPKEYLKNLKGYLKDLEGWKAKPTLCHGDMRVKNMLVNEDGKITAILDWEMACSNIAPWWELSIALHDLAVDEKQAFLEGYGISVKDFIENAWIMKTINVINYAPYIKMAMDNKDNKAVEVSRMRFHSMFDMYTL